jgi:hypothetical protein
MAGSAEWTLEVLRQLFLAARDDPSGMLGTIVFEHHKIHIGDSFVCHYSNTVTNNGEMTVIAFNTPDTAGWVHVVVEYTATALARALLIEAPSIDLDEGTDLAVFNRNRNSAKTSGISNIKTVPEANEASSYDEVAAAAANITINAANTVSEHHIGGVAVGPGGTSGSQLQRNEYILKQNTQYAIILEALNNDTGIHNIHASWYEQVSLV